MDEAESVLCAPPGDGISCLRCSTTSNILLLSSWDSTARLYDISANIPKVTFNLPAASLTCCFRSDEVGFAGGLDRVVHSLNLEKGSSSAIGIHTAPVSCLQWSPENNTLYSGSWDGSIGLWDPRSPTSHTPPLAASSKVYSLSLTSTRLAVATSDRHITIYDKRNLSAPEQIRESPLRYMTRQISCLPSEDGFVIGSIEGRVAVEYFNDRGTAAAGDPPGRNYAFKCHRRSDVAYPVNAFAFHPTLGTFATGGGDGTVSVWDGVNKKRLVQYPQYPTSIASLAFNHDGSVLAIASSYTFEEGEKPPSTTGLDDMVFLRRIQEDDVRPRPKVQ